MQGEEGAEHVALLVMEARAAPVVAVAVALVVVEAGTHIARF